MQKNTVLEEKDITTNIVNWWVRAWNSIITIGISDDTPSWDKKKTRLLNGICVMASIVYIAFVFSYASSREHLVFWESLQAAFFYLIPIALNYYKYHNLASHFFCIYNIVCYSFFAITHGEVDGVEYQLLTSSIAAMLFFRSIKRILIYFFLNLVFFWICKYSFKVMKPILTMPNGENLYVQNQTLLFILCFLIVYYFRTENTRQEHLLEKKNNNLSEEKQKSDDLLLNILPAEISNELKNTGKTAARSYKMVTVMFADFVDFTKIAEKLNPEELVFAIGEYFETFDKIIEKYEVEKIKTVGDAYVCAAGLPNPTSDNATVMTKVAFDFLGAINELRMQRQMNGKEAFDVRIGINTGSVVAGVVGIKKFAYDIWGDTVNTAARMQEKSLHNRINISGATYQYVKDQFDCEYRGKIEAKNKGEIDMYFVKRARESIVVGPL